MGEGFDLAAVAGMAGFGGSAIATIGALMFFKGVLLRILTQVIVTAALTFVGFIALLDFLGFEIVPREDVAMRFSPAGAETFSVQSAPVEPVSTEKRTYAVKSPWSR